MTSRRGFLKQFSIGAVAATGVSKSFAEVANWDKLDLEDTNVYSKTWNDVDSIATNPKQHEFYSPLNTINHGTIPMCNKQRFKHNKEIIKSHEVIQKNLSLYKNAVKYHGDLISDMDKEPYCEPMFAKWGANYYFGYGDLFVVNEKIGADLSIVGWWQTFPQFFENDKQISFEIRTVVESAENFNIILINNPSEYNVTHCVQHVPRHNSGYSPYGTGKFEHLVPCNDLKTFEQVNAFELKSIDFENQVIEKIINEQSLSYEETLCKESYMFNIYTYLIKFEQAYRKCNNLPEIHRSYL